MTKTTARIHFEEPPARAHRALVTKHEAIAAKLKKRPGQWALIEVYTTLSSANSIGYMVRTGKTRAYGPRNSFEAVSRTRGRKYGVWARYIGEHGEYA